MPELLGIGATVPKDGEGRREEWSGNERLGRQLLGRDYGRVIGKVKGEIGVGRASHGAGVVGMGRGRGRGNKSHPAPPRRDVGGDSEDEGGRSSLGKSKLGKRKRVQGRESDHVGDGGLEAEKAAVYGLEEEEGLKKRAGNYLDEVLADRSLKKGKKKRKKERAAES